VAGSPAVKLDTFDPRHWPLQIKFPVTVVAIVYSVALIAGVIAQVWETKLVRNALENRAQQLALTLVLSNAESVARMDYWVLYANLSKQAGVLDQEMAPLLFGSIVNDEGIVLAHTHPERQRIGILLAELDSFEGMYSDPGLVVRYGTVHGNEALLVSAPVEYRGKRIGSVLLGFDTDFIRERVLATVIAIGAVSTLLAIIGSLLSWVYSRRTIKPIVSLTASAEKIRAGQLDEIAPIQVYEKNEIGDLVATFNGMVEQLKERDALNAQLQVSEKLAAIGRLVSGVAHEINNPVGGMKNALECLRMFSNDPKRREESIHLLESGLGQIEGVVDSLLVQHRSTETISVCNPRCLDDLFLLVRHDCELRNIRIDWRNELGRPFMVFRARLQQVLINLLVNAMHAMPEGGTLTFHASERDSTLAFVVEDTGSGMPQKQIDRIFEPFFTTRPNGTGLGLWVSMGLVHAMGGDLEVESEVGKGTRFSVIIPRIPADTERETDMGVSIRSEKDEPVHH